MSVAIPAIARTFHKQPSHSAQMLSSASHTCTECIELAEPREIASQPISNRDLVRLDWYQEQCEQAQSDLIAHRERCLLCKPQPLSLTIRAHFSLVSQNILSYFRTAKFYSQMEIYQWKSPPARNVVQAAQVARNVKGISSKS